MPESIRVGSDVMKPIAVRIVDGNDHLDELIFVSVFFAMIKGRFAKHVDYRPEGGFYRAARAVETRLRDL